MSYYYRAIKQTSQTYSAQTAFRFLRKKHETEERREAGRNDERRE
jgi:hypothetical protein